MTGSPTPKDLSQAQERLRERAPIQGLPTREPERYVSRRELAVLMGVCVATVDRLVAAGMPSTTWGRRTRRFKASTAIAWARAQDRAA